MTLSRCRCRRLFVLISLAALAAAGGRAAGAAAPPPVTVPLSPEELKLRVDWRTSMAQIPLPEKACFQAAYPDKLWVAVPCTTPPPFPMLPRRGHRPLTVGNGSDVSAEAPAGFISATTGTFAVAGVTSESALLDNVGSPVADAYTLQINTNFFSSSACAGSPNPDCLAWEQFVFLNYGSGSGALFIQYWLIQYNATCPAGEDWNQFSFSGSSDIYCWKNNSVGAAAVTNQPITNLAHLAMTGSVSVSADRNLISAGTMMWAVPGDNTVDAAAGWQISEFNVVGPGGGSQANFNSGATVTPRVEITYHGAGSPICVPEGFTGETNNLSFGPTAPAASPPGPALLFTQSTTGGAASPCAAATSVGTAPLDYYTVTPCRVFDSRSGSPLSNGTRNFQVTGKCGIPTSAKAISANLTTVGPQGAGFLTLYPGDATLPQASTINFTAGQVLANNIVVELALDGTGTLNLYASIAGATSTTNALLDVSGYFQ